MLTTVLLIRHGQTDWNLARRWQGHADIPLNETGLAQAHLLAERLPSWPVKAIYSSDLQRAAQTAAIIGHALTLEPIYEFSWRERNGGNFQGLTIEQLQADHPQELKLLREDGAAPPNGESRLALAKRVTAAFELVTAQHHGQTIAIVSHGGALAALIAHLLGFPLGQRARISLGGNTGLSIVEIKDFGPRITLLNDVSHLSSLTQQAPS